MSEIIFDRLIPFIPITWKRPRFAAFQNAAGKLQVRGYNDKKYDQAKANLGWEFKAADPKIRCSSTDRFGFRCTFRLARPRGQAGDGDRYENLVMDALQGIVWEDDSQVDEGSWTKIYNADLAGVWLTIWKLP